MPGPTPKPASTRQRRNKTSTNARLIADHDLEAPDLPTHPQAGDGEDWHPMAVDFWEDVWASPMAPEFLDADVHGLYVILALTDLYWRNLTSGKPVTGLAMELRLQRQSFGLSPIDRRRLQWEVDKGEEAAERAAKRRRKSSHADAGPAGDPDDIRATLSVLEGGA